MDGRHPAQSRRRGFSLVEVLIVLAIISILAGMAAVNYRNYLRNSDLRTAARGIASDVKLHREKALTEGVHYRMVFSVAQGSYIIEKGTGTGAPYILDQIRSQFQNISLVSAGFAGSPSNQIVFSSRGTVRNGTITLRNENGSTATIVVAITGRTKVNFHMQ